MNSTSERAREACQACRKSHKKCLYDDNSMQCSRCAKRDVPCSLFLSVETEAIAQPGPPASVVTGTPHDSAIHSGSSPAFSPYETCYWPTAVPMDGQYPANMVLQTPVTNQHESEQPAINPDVSLYYSGYGNMFNT